MKLFTLLLVLIALVFAAPAAMPTDPVSLRNLFDEYKTQFGKSYAARETARRFSNFVESVKRINKKNSYASSQGYDTTFGLNKFSDMSLSEFKRTILMPKYKPVRVEGATEITPDPNVNAPATFDWRQQGAVTAVKNQGQCGSCWAFSTVENVESICIIAGKGTASSLILSEQQVVDCDTSDGGCNGGNPPTAYQYIISAGGLESESNYPYTAENQNCAFNNQEIAVDITGWNYAGSDTNSVQSNLVSVGPLSICVDASNWSDYTGGVLTADQCGDQLDHCVQLVGYDTTQSTPYWMVRNSWGTDWGNNGYIQLQFGQDTCGMLDEVTSSTC